MSFGSCEVEHEGRGRLYNMGSKGGALCGDGVYKRGAGFTKNENLQYTWCDVACAAYRALAGDKPGATGAAAMPGGVVGHSALHHMSSANGSAAGEADAWENGDEDAGE